MLMTWELLERTGAAHPPVLLPDGRCSGLLGRCDIAVACSVPAVVLSALDVGPSVSGRRRVAVRAQNSVGRAARSMMELTASDIAAALIRIPAPGRAAERGPFSMIPGLGPPPRRPGEPRSMSGITG
ncbi:hypothetical protein SSAG_00065 [Streptomyces sp. Mg1]|nr:hypothetical protein SSAG_00065 [Streptomyces sp. Mg1]